MKKFDVEFKKLTDNKYPFVRFVRAEYSVSDNNLILHFLASAQSIDGGVLSDRVKDDIVKAVVPLVPDEITFSVRYTKVYADEDTVRVKLMQAMQKYMGIAAGMIKPEDVSIQVNDYVIDVKIKAQKAYSSMLKADDVKEKLVDYLNENFVENVNFEVAEKYISDEEKKKITEKSLKTVENAGFNCDIKVSADGTVKEDGNDVFSDLIDPSDDTIVFYGDARQIKATALENLVGKAYMNVLPMYTFTIDDTTGKLSVVYFARDTKVNALDLSLRDERNVVISGKLSDRNGSKQIMVDKMWLADVDYSTIKTELPQKSANKNYYLVRPEKYFEESQSSMDDLLGGEKEVAPYLKGKTFVVFDLETTGLDVQHCMVVQLGSYKIVDGKIVETFNTLINPCCHIPEATSAIHGIYDSDVVCAPEFKDVVPDFFKFTRGATLVGHNACGYDLPILSRLARESGYNFDNPVLDTLILAKQQYRLPSYNLGNLAKHFHIDLENAHNADFDAIATAKLFIILAEKLK